MQAFMMVSGTVVDRWLRSTVQDLKENNLTVVLCPCRRCKGRVWFDPYDAMAHLLMTGFVDGYTRWIIEDDDDDVEDADGAGNDDTGQDEEKTWWRGRGRTWRRIKHGLHAADFVDTKFNHAGPSFSSTGSQGDEY